jgi:hypothetical protein
MDKGEGDFPPKGGGASEWKRGKPGTIQRRSSLTALSCREYSLVVGRRKAAYGNRNPLSLSNFGVEHQTRQVPVTVVKTLFFDPPRKRA